MSATSRFGLIEASGGLFLLQDLLNTRGIPEYGVRDLLGTVRDAQRWASSTMRQWGNRADDRGRLGRLTTADLPVLRRLRDDLHGLVEHGRTSARRVPCAVELTPDGRTALRPAGNGTRWLASAVWGEVLLAQRDGSWERLKTCRNPVCPCVFHDASRNNSRVWHDVHSCGNIANLRASRARRRAESATS